MEKQNIVDYLKSEVGSLLSVDEMISMLETNAITVGGLADLDKHAWENRLADLAEAVGAFKTTYLG